MVALRVLSEMISRGGFFRGNNYSAANIIVFVRFGSKADPHVQSLIIASLREAIDVSSDRIDFPD
jgi:hypothetical protein